MTQQQQKVLAKIRSAGVMDGSKLSTYEWRSIDRLVKDGFVNVTPCGKCNWCPNSCTHPSIKAASP